MAWFLNFLNARVAGVGGRTSGPACATMSARIAEHAT